MPGNLGTAFINILPNTGDFGRKLTAGVRPGMVEAGEAVDGFIQRVEEIPESFGVAGDAVNAFTGGALKNLSSLGHTIHTKMALAAETAFAGTGVRLAANVERGLREVNTLFGLTGAAAERSFGQVSESVRELSNELGIAQTTLTQGLYQALSAGVPRENAMDFLRVATKVAIGGVTDTETAVDGLSTAINAFGLTIDDAEMVADSFFTTVVGGKTTMGELASSFSNVAPVAAAAGIRIQEVNAAIATLTAAGVPTGEATTQIRAAIQGLVRPSEEVDAIFASLGYTNAEAAIQMEGLGYALNAVQRATGGSTGELSKLLGSIEAVNAAQIIAGTGAEKFAAEMDNQANAAGAANRAFSEMEKSQARTFERLRTSVENFAIVIGEALGPAIRALTGLLERATDFFMAWPKPLQQAVGLFIGLATALGPPIYLIARLVISYQALRSVQAGIVALNAGKTIAAAGDAAKMAARNTISYNVALGAMRTVDFARHAREIGMVATATNVARSAFSGLMTVINPWTVALGLATSVLLHYSNAKRQAQALSEKYTATLDAETGAITDRTKAEVAQNIASDEVADALSHLGMSYADLGDIILGSEDAANAFIHRLQLMRDGGEENEKAYSALVNVISKNRKAVHGSTDSFVRKKQAAKALGVEIDGLGGQVEGLTEKLTDGQKAMEQFLSGVLGLSGVYQDELSRINTEAAESARKTADAAREAADERLRAVRDGLEAERDALESRHDAELDALVGNEEAQEIIRRRHEQERKELDRRADAELKAAEKTVKAERDRADAIEETAKRTKLTADEVKKAARKRIADTRAYFGNLAVIAQRGGTDIIDELMQLGPEGADMIAELARMSQPELDDFVTVVRQGSAEAVTAIRKQFDELPATMDSVAKIAGKAFRDALLEDLRSGKITIEDIFAIHAGLLPKEIGGGVWQTKEGVRFAQHGGRFRRGELAVVGEAGPELVRFGAGANVIPNGSAFGGRGVVIENLNVPTAADASADEVAAAIGTTLAWRIGPQGWN